MKRLLQVLGTVVLLLVATGAAQALTLSDLVDRQIGIINGDKVFSDWTLISQDTSDGHTVDMANIEVTTLADDGSGYGLNFHVLNDEFTVTGDDNAYTQFSFGFHVSVLDPLYKITDNSLAFGSFGGAIGYQVDGSNDTGMNISEYLGTAAGFDDLDIAEIEFSVLDDAQTLDGSDSATFAPQSELWVTKNILVWSQDSTDGAALWGFDQRFSQVAANPVPEPTTMLLLGTGLVGVAGATRRKKKNQA